MDNARIADRLEALAGLLELAEANPYSARAYRRAAETVRGAPVPVADLVRAGRVRQLRGIGSSIEAKLRELVETGAIAELAELERELAPDLVGFGRYLGLTAKRTLEIARALDVRTAGRVLRDAALAGRLQTARGVGPKTEARLLEALARAEQPRPRQGLLLNRARELVGAIANALGGDGRPATPRRWRDACEHLAVVCAAADPRPVLARFVELPQIVALLSAEERRVVGLTVEGVPVELVVAAPGAVRHRARRAHGRGRLGRRARARCRTRPTRTGVFRALGMPWWPPELREAPLRGDAAAALELDDIRGDLHSHTTWSDGRASVEEMGRAARDRGYAYLAICDHTPAVGAVRGLTRRRRPPPGRGDRRRQRGARAVPRPARDRVRHPARRPARPPRRRAGRARLGPGQRPRRPADARPPDDRPRAGGAPQPLRPLPQPPHGALHQPPARERARPRPGLRGRARARRRARDQRAADRLDLRAEHVRDAIRAGVALVCSTDAHSPAGLANMQYAVARRAAAGRPPPTSSTRETSRHVDTRTWPTSRPGYAGLPVGPGCARTIR